MNGSTEPAQSNRGKFLVDVGEHIALPPQALVITCPDSEKPLLKAINLFLERYHQISQGECFLHACAGGPAPMAYPKDLFMLNQALIAYLIQTLEVKPSIKKVFLCTHYLCGFYEKCICGKVPGVKKDDTLRPLHDLAIICHNAELALQKAGKREVAVLAFYISREADGKIGFRRVLPATNSSFV